MSILFAIPPSAYAVSLAISPSFQHDGLEFSDPLDYSTQTSLPITPMTIIFEKKEITTFKKPLQESVLAESIITPQPTAVSIPTPTLLPTQTPTPIITITPTPTPPLPTSTPTPPITTNQTTSGGLNADKLFSMANDYRAAKGLPPFQKDEKSCQLAAERAPEVAGEVASGALHSGLHARNLPYWNTENIISMRTEEEAFNWWINDYIHRKAIEGNFQFSCVACYGNNCAQEFTNYQPK